MNPAEQGLVLFSRNLEDRVEGVYRVKRCVRKGHVRHVSLEKRRLGDEFPRQFDLPAGEVDPRGLEALRKQFGRGDSRAAAEIQNVRTLWQAV